MKTWSSFHHLSDYEFRVFSQFGDDGIIQHLIRNAEIDGDVFIEFGVGDYSESNTRFLLINNNWRGLVMDRSKEKIKRIKRQQFFWKHDLTAIDCWVDTDNINSIIKNNGFAGPLGLLSIDIDGNDYWIWNSLEVVAPTIVVIEYNSVFGDQQAVTVPYERDFNRTRAHYSNLYWGASLRAMCMLAERKGYAFAGCNSTGNNSYFVRKDRLGGVRAVSLEEGYVTSRYRESRDNSGILTFLSGDERLRCIEDMAVVDIQEGRTKKIRDLKFHLCAPKLQATPP